MNELLNILIIAAGFIMIVASMALPRIFRPRPEVDARGYPLAKPVSEDRRALERVEQGLIQLEETSREVFARIDTRTRVLVRLIEDAEVKAKQLEDQINRQRGGV